MANSNSLFNKFSRYVGGGTTETANNFIEWWERATLDKDDSDIVYTVENFYEGRLDLIASVFYNEPRWWWILAQYNNILDPFNEVTAGRVLLIPSKERLSFMITTKQGGVDSTKQPVNTISPVVI
jgi:hypothetical protein